MAGRTPLVAAALYLCVVAYIASDSQAFLPVENRTPSSAASTAGLVGAAAATAPQAAGAFTFEGEEYFDIWFGV
eukprot:CAMPEP_0178402534 /NCGR_PEP_ID=MMETSP0689_2-20121128/16893_1 /TAXON_ID=160604 /ORGANISM="Amphidinium massartii, Strain CS-259" /LENGTH=73 /DNA_ID=CAMNT_0020023441 /DNA_START=110 /DNA_END=327 /DNA_ORIENTATION=+